MAADTPWESGRFDLAAGPGKVLFGRMYEDPAVELAAFPPGGRVFCIASAGCTAFALAARHEVTAVDINPVQLSYAQRRLAGAPAERGRIESLLAFVRGLGSVAGWTRRRREALVALSDPAEQLAYFRRHLDTRRFRLGFDTMLSFTGLRAVYAAPFLRDLPPRFGAVMRGRIERCLATHPNTGNPYARALFLGELPPPVDPACAARVRLSQADAASYLEACPPGSFDGLTLSNVLDGAPPAYRRRLFAATRRAAAPGAVVVLRSIAEPPADLATNRASADRSILWGLVDVRPVEALDAGE